MAVIDTLTAKVRNYLKKTGDAMISGDLTLFQDPTEDMHAVTKQYVDDLFTQAGDTWGRQDYLPWSQWGRRGVIGINSAPTFMGMGLMHGTQTFVSTPAATQISGGAPGVWMRGTVSAASAAGTEAGAAAFVEATERRQLPIWECRMRTGPGAVDIVGWRLWFGLSDATAGVSSPQNGVNPNTLECAGFRFFPVGGTPDTTWFAVSGNMGGAAGQSTNTGVTVAAATIYDLKIDMSVSGEIRYYINDVLVHTESTVLPAIGVNMGIVSIARQVTTGTLRTIDWMGDALRNTLNL